jgi:uncharacterized damage-inducible protein DinB
LTRLEHIQLMARYNLWMNDKLLVAAARLTAGQLVTERQAFFGSILGTLNHLLVGDIIWLKRFSTHPAGFSALGQISALPDPQNLREASCASLEQLAPVRRMVDQAIFDWAAGLYEADLDVTLNYVNMAGVNATRDFHALLVHFFNHQTHHRGQTTTLLSQAGVDVGTTDLIALVEDL